ncbi:MAG TPA: tetratricopeptide repeat protein [Planctomycetota bacterium]|nr:tetratricopeptide repeat protein [Planctomycetota bacterium]
MLGFFARSVIFGETESPLAVQMRIAEQVQLPNYDKRNALRDLGRALKHPEARASEAISSELLRLRANIYRDMGAYDKARSDVERLRSMTGSNEVALELEAIELQALEGQPEEALRRIEVLAFHHPTSADVAILRGTLETRRGKELETKAQEIAAHYLIDEEAKQAAPIIVRLCSQHPHDPKRARALQELRVYFEEGRGEYLESILDACDLASDHYTQARASLAKGLEYRLEIPALSALLHLLVESGRSDLVVDLGVSSRVFPEIMNSPTNLLSLMDAMENLGQTDRIGRIVSKWPWAEAGGDADFYRKTARVLFLSGRWGPLGNPANALRSFSPSEVALADFYSGYLLTLNKRYEEALRLLSRFLGSGSPGPTPGARATAYRMTAECWRGLGDPTKELRALKGVIAERSDLQPEDYLHLAEAQAKSPNALPIVAEESWTKGMALGPARSVEWMPMWETLGEQTFGTLGISFDTFYDSLLRQKLVAPTQKVGPYTTWRIGMRYLKEKRYQSALTLAGNLLRQYPGLLPAIDLRLETLLNSNDNTHSGPDTLLQRMRLVGADEASERYLARYEVSRFTTEEQLELVRLNPYGVGRLRTAEYLLDRGDFERVGWVLRAIPEHPDPPNMHALRIRALVASGQYEPAIQQAEIWLTDPKVGEECTRLTLQAYLRLGDEAGVAQTLRRLVAIPLKNAKERLALAKELLEAGMYASARPLLQQLNASKPHRTPEVLYLIAQCEAMAGEAQTASEWLDRCAPFFNDGKPELAQIVLATGFRAWPGLPILFERLHRSGFQPTPIQDAALAILEERFQMGKALATDGCLKDPENPHWALLQAAAQLLLNQEPTLSPVFGERALAEVKALLSGQEDARHDPRDAVAIVLALHTPGWAPWAQKRALELQTDGANSLWTALLEADAWSAMDHPLRAEQVERDALKSFADCKVAWNGLVKALQDQHPEDPLHPDLIEAWRRRMQVPELRNQLNPRETTLGLAAVDMANGQPGQAIDTLQRYLNAMKGSDASVPSLLLGRLLVQRGDYKDAVDCLRAVIMDNQERGLHPWMVEYLGWIQEGSSTSIPSAQRLSKESVAKTLDNLAFRFPTDPAVALKRLEFRMQADERSALLAEEEARGALDLLRSRVGDRDLDQLRKGSNQQWMQHFLKVSPILGEQFCKTGLSKNPGNLDLWLGLSSAYLAQGRFEEARNLVADLLKVSDDPELQYRYASLLALEGEPSAKVRHHLQQGDAARGLVGNSARSRFLQAQMVLMEGSGGLDNVLNELSSLWGRRDQIAMEVAPLELGRTYLTALVLRHQEADMEVLSVLTEEMLQYANQDPYAEDVIRTFRSMGKAISERVVETVEAQ